MKNPTTRIIKTISIFTLFVCILTPLFSKEGHPSDQPLQIGSSSITFTGLPSDFLYPSYLADPLAVRSEISYKSLLINEVNPTQEGQGGRFDIVLGARFSFLRFSPLSNPDLGLEMDWGMALPVYMNSKQNDLLALDGIYYFSLGIRPLNWLAFRISRHHICTHVGDELDRDGDGGEYFDYDPSVNANISIFVRDDYLFSAAFEPMKLFKDNYPLSILLYGDISIFIHGFDLLGNRNNKSSDHAYIWFQGGAEFRYDISQKHNAGQLFAAGQISAWQITGYVPNYSFQAGYILPPGRKGQQYKFAFTYYDGQSIINNFIYRRERYMGALLTIER
ncbi:MAG: hypothetical protein EOM67_06220 [Spirochaetia bacterium]|nr:hypothetical protein [Spirochaetia bacterium]